VNDSSGGGRVRIAQSSSADEKEIPEEEGEDEEEASLSIDDLKTSLRSSLEGVLSFPLSYFAASCPMGFFFFFFFFFLMYRILFLEIVLVV
jgi:hypothetical protein